MTEVKYRRRRRQGPGTTYKDLGDLQDLLTRACPRQRGEDPRISMPQLAQALGISHQYVYRWIETSHVPPRFVSQIVARSKGRLSLEDFHPYVFPSVPDAP